MKPLQKTLECLFLCGLLAVAIPAGPIPASAQDEAPPAETSATPEAPSSDEMDDMSEDVADKEETSEAETGARAEILEMIEKERQAYLADDPQAVAALYGDVIVSVAGGQVVEISHSDLADSLVNTLERVDYLEVETLGEPIMRFSEDGNFAWVALRQRVRRSAKVAEGQEQEGEVVFAGSSTYQKHGDGWRKTSTVSTFGR